MNLAEFRAEHEIDAGGWHYIYGLHDPRTGELRYIGKSDRPLERLSNQIQERAATHRCHWIQSLRNLGLRPVQTIIDAVPPGADWQSVERAYIAGAKLAGCRLTNGTDGGDGVPGLSDEAKARMRAANVGRKASAETRARMSAARKGKFLHTPEWRVLMSEKMRDREFSPEHRDRIRRGVQKLTVDQVREIRALLADGISQYVIAEQYGIHQGSVSNIARRVTYSHVDPEGDR